MQIFRISDLEAATGLPRSTIYHYQRVGLLPPVHRTGGSPASYCQAHVEALENIRGLREEGLSVAAIRSRFEDGSSRPQPEPPDLAEEASRAIKRRILEHAALQFARKGYQGTRLVDIFEATGVSANMFYGYFGGKRQLFVQVVDRFVREALTEGQDRICSEPDPVKRHLLRATRFLSLRDLSPEMLTFLRAEALDADDDTKHLLSDIYRELVRYILEDLRTLRREAAVQPSANDEMLAFALFGAKESVAMRLTWDADFSLEDYLWANLEVFLSVRALYGGPTDFVAERRRYAPFVGTLAARPPIGVPPQS